MANETISQLPDGTPAQPTDLVPIARGNSNVSLPVAQINLISLSSPDSSLSISGSPGNSFLISLAAALGGAANILPGSYLYANLPAASANVNKYAVSTDQGAVFSNGVDWQILFNATRGSLAISTNSPLPPATQSAAYTDTLVATSGVAPYTWSMVYTFGATNSWALSSGGVLTGTPANLETDALLVQVSDSTGAVAQKLLTIQTIVPTTPAATPTFSPVAGTYVGTQNVTISCATASPTIYYTTNGSTPTTGSPVYSSPVSVPASATLKAIATAPGFAQSAVGTAVYTINAGVNPMGVNIPAGGGTAFSYENFPFFKNRVREGRGFTVPSGGYNVQVALSAAGWPTVDFACFLWEGTVIPSWLTAGVFKCGFIGSGSETITGLFGGSVSNVVHHAGPSYTTFDLTFTSQGGFIVTGTGGTVTNVYAYLPGYDMGAIDDPTTSAAFTAESILHYTQYAHLRLMKATAVETNTQVSTSATRHTPANCQSDQSFGGSYQPTFTAAPGVGATSATLTAPWAKATGQWGLPIRSSDLTVGRVCNVTNGSTAVTWSDPLLTAGTSTFQGGIGTDGYPIEWWVAFCNACNIGIWINTPVLEDGTNFSAGSWSSAVLAYLAANWTSAGTIYFELANENWNFGAYPSPWLLWGLSRTLGYYVPAGNDVSGYYAYRLHAFANLARTYFPTTFGTKVKQILCYQTLPGGMFYTRHILNQLALLTTPKLDVQLVAIAPYVHPTLGATDSIATIQAATNTKAAIHSLEAWCENNAILAAHWAMQFGTYEDGGDWGNATYSGITNLNAAILDAGMQAPFITHYQSNMDCGSALNTHFLTGVTQSTSPGFGYELTNIYASPLTSPTLQGIQTFMSGNFTPTRNLVAASGAIVNGVNFADNNASILNAQGCFNLANGGNFAPYGQGGRCPYVIWCTDPRANSGPVTYSLQVTFSAVTGSPTTDLEIGDPVNGFTTIATGITVVNGVNTLGNITLKKGFNYVLLGRNGAQGTNAQNLISQLQFI